MQEYCNYEKIMKNIERIKEGDVLYVVSDILELTKICKRNGEKFDRNRFIDTIIEKVGITGTVLIPTFNWDFCKGKTFDYLHTPSQTGALGNAALGRKDFKRTKHPIYSFAVWGKDKELLCNMDSKSSFGKETVFDYMVKKHGKSLVIGLPTMAGIAVFHHVEEMVGVPFRFNKDFAGNYVDENGNVEEKTYSMYVRDLEINAKEETAPLNHILEALNVSNTQIINEIPFRTVYLQELYLIEEMDIKYNDCRNMYCYKGQTPQKELTEKYEWNLG
ncbi:MAG: AAC(3) family N-acetyltransferase [Acetivibrio sp.]